MEVSIEIIMPIYSSEKSNFLT